MTIRRFSERFAKEAKDLWLKPDHDCDEAPSDKERYIIHYIHLCEGCLAQLLTIAFRRKARKAAR